MHKPTAIHPLPQGVFKPMPGAWPSLSPLARRIVALALLCVLASAAHAATYHVETTGTDGAARNGSASQPWKTLAYAATRATAIGDLIQIGAGTFEESAMTSLKPGVSLEGAGETLTTITSIANPTGNLLSWLITMGSWNTDIPVAGNQSISKMTLDGRTHTVHQAIGCYGRSGVTFHHLTFKDFSLNGLQISGSYTPLLAANAQWPDNPPPDTAYCSNLLIQNCTFLNGGYNPPGASWAYGDLGFSGVRDSVVRNCSFDERTYGGWGIKGSWFKNSNIHNCVVRVAPTDPDRGKDFSIEIWYTQNCQFYDIWANGAFSIGFNDNVRIHHNEIVTLPGENASYGVEFGGKNSSVDHNWFDNVVGVDVWCGPYNDCTIAHNVFRKGTSAIFTRSGAGTQGGVSNLHVYNNTLDNCGTLYNGGPISLNAQDAGPLAGTQIKNNIVVNTTVTRAAVTLGGLNSSSDTYASYVSGTVITNNLFNNNAGGNFYQTASVVGTVSSPNTVANPLFKGGTNAVPSPYYELQPGSPALGTGVDVGLPYLGNAPDIGAFVQPIDQRIEAEMNFSVATDVGTTSAVAVDNLNLDSYKSVQLADTGDTLRIHFKVLTAGYYDLAARIRSGSWTVATNSDHNPTGYFANAYAYQIDGVGASFAGDVDSVSAPDSSGGGVYWGTMRSAGVYLPAGLHHLEIRMTATGGLVDWLEVVKVAGSLDQATTYTWIGTTAGNWSDSAKWDANGAPVSDQFYCDVVLNPGALALTETVDGIWNTTGSGYIHSLTLQSGTNTIANGLAGTNLKLGTGGFTNNSGNAATFALNSPAGGTLTAAGTQTWLLNGQNLTIRGNLTSSVATDVLTLDTGTGAGKTILFNGTYTTRHPGTLYLKNSAGTAGNSLTFDTPRSGAHDRFANLIIDNNDTSQNFTLGFLNDASNSTMPANIEFRNFTATTNNRFILNANPTNTFGNPNADSTLNFTGNWSGNLKAKTAGGSQYSVLYNGSNAGRTTLSGDNSLLEIDVNDVAHEKFLFASSGGAIVANSPHAMGLNNTLGIGIGALNSSTPSERSAFWATPVAGTVNSSIWVFGNNYNNPPNSHAQPCHAQVGLPAEALASDTVTFNGDIFLQSFTGQETTLRLTTGLKHDPAHGGTAIFNGAIQDSATSNGGNPLNPLTESSPGVVYHGSGSFQVNGANSYVGRTTIRGGTVLLGGDAPAGAPVIVTNPAAADAGATTLTLTDTSGLLTGMPLANGVANIAPGTRITGIAGNQITLSLPTTGTIAANTRIAAGGGALGASISAVSLGDVVPALVTVKAASIGFNDYKTSTWSAGDGVSTFTKFTFTGTAAESLDGVTLVTGDKVLVWGRYADTHTNGVYVVNTAAKTWTRDAALDSTAEILANPGMRVHVTYGTVSGGKDFFLAPVAGPWNIDKSPTAGTNDFGTQTFFADVTDPAVALLTNGAYTVGRDIDVANNNSAGKSVLGGNTADTSVFSGTVTLHKNLSLTAASGGSVTFSGDLTGSADITKEGPGTVILTNPKTHTGNLHVAEGVLGLNGPLASGAVTVASGATLQGGGTVSNILSAAGTLAPGNSVGTMIAGPITLTGTLAVEIDGASNDKLLSTGTIDLTGATLTVTELAGGFARPYYVIAEGTSLTGTFNSVPTGYAVTYTATQAILSTTQGAAYAGWAVTRTWANASTDSLPAADPDGDGLTNQQEYAFGLDPALGTSSNPISVPLDKNSGTFSYTRRKTALTGLGYTITSSPDLRIWTTDGGAVQTVTDTSGDVETVRVTLSPAVLTAPQLFIRVSAMIGAGTGP